jgi:hypothetical protein
MTVYKIKKLKLLRILIIVEMKIIFIRSREGGMIVR